MESAEPLPAKPADLPVAAGSAATEGDAAQSPRSRRGRWRALALPAATGVAAVAAVVLLHVRDPHVGGAYGICPLYGLAGIYCPGCGGMRAVNNLTDGRIVDSLQSNLFALPLLIAFALWVGDWLARAWREQPMRDLSISWFTMWVLLGAIAVYTVVRNTPWGTWLAPA